MKKAEAYAALGVSEAATQDEIKKAFKKKAKELHPDINKSPDAETQFKIVNEAYQAIEHNTFDDNIKSNPFSNINNGFDFIDFSNLGDIFNWNNSSHNKYIKIEDIKLEQTISFKESVLGCSKDIKYKCDIACGFCGGRGEKQISNGCKTCNGSGKTYGKSGKGNMFFYQTCKSCRGKLKFEKCNSCVNGKISSDRSVSVSINPGISDGTILRLTNMGNFIGYSIGNSNVLITIKVVKDAYLTIRDNDVITNTSISLLEALTGCTKNIHTIDGEQEITIPKLTKNKDEVIIEKLGVGRFGNERIIINIEYPEDISKLIDILK